MLINIHLNYVNKIQREFIINLLLKIPSLNKQIYSQKYQMVETDDKIQPHVQQRYEIVKKIGCGAYGVVWKVIDKKHKTIHALKKNFDAFQNSTDAQRTYREVMFLNQVKHPNIISLQKIIKAQNQRDIYLVFQFMDIDLYTLIRENILQQKHKRYIIYQIAKSIYYLHTGELIHRDIKPSNILVNENCMAKMCDFGLVRSVEQDQDSEQEPFLTQYIATRWYRAPQILLGSKRYSKAVDVWSFGCLIGEIIKGRPLFPGTSTLNQIQRVLTWTGPPTLNDIKSLKTDFGKEMLDLVSKIKKINKNEWFNSISNQGYDLLSKTLQFNPEKRITMLQVLQHPFLKEFFSEQEIIQSQIKIRIPIDDNKKLSLKDYRSLIYKFIKQFQNSSQGYQSTEKNMSLKSSLGPFKNLIQTKKVSNSTYKQLISITKQLRENANKTISKNRMYKNSAFYQTSTQKSKAHSLGVTNKSTHKKVDEIKELKKQTGDYANNKKYESFVKKKKSLTINTKTKHIRTQEESQKDDMMGVYGPKKYVGGVNYHNPQLPDTTSHLNPRMFGSAEKVQNKKATSLHDNRRKSQGLAKYMYKHKYF